MRIVVSFLLVCVLTLPAYAGQKLSFGFINAPLSSSSLEVLKAAYAKLDIEVEGVTLPAARALAQSDAGLTDGEVHRIKDIENKHPNLIRIDVPINAVEGIALSCGSQINDMSREALSKLRIGIKVGNIYAENWVKGFPRVTRLPDEKKLLELLMAGRLDVFIVDRPWGISQSRMKGQECLRINEPPIVTIPLYHYLHIKNVELVPRITSILRTMKTSGEMQTIRDEALKKYTLKEW